MLKKIVDVIAAAVVTLGGPLFRIVGNWPGNYPLYLRQADRMGAHWRSTHYYHPTYSDRDLPADVTAPRDLPGLDLREDAQLSLLASFSYGEELLELTEHEDPTLAYRYDNGQYGPVDAELLYSMIRSTKPKRIFEIGSGNSTRVAAKAIARNKLESPGYACRHLCIEPYEMSWLEKLGPEIRRQRAEDVPQSLFDELEAGDILFIDSSHVIRPFGDVLFEFQQIIPRLAKSVMVHVHDVFTPRDYPELWLRAQRRLWNEQYLLEVMLAHNPRYRVVLGASFLAHDHYNALMRAFPHLKPHGNLLPAAFWFEIVA